MPRSRLTMKFDPLTIEHLGVRLYSTLPPVLAELIANSYDADATSVVVHLKDNGKTKEITVADNGMGMAFTEINDKFLKIGRNRRNADGVEKTPKGRMVIGKKGLGKLSFFGIAREVEISTKKDGYHNTFIMKWDNIESEIEEYHPELIVYNKACPKENAGTTVTLRDIQRVSDFQPEEISNSLSKMFIIDDDFQISVQLNDGDPIGVENEGKYSELDKEIEWDIPADLKEEWECEVKDKIVGHLIATKKPISPKTNMRGITLFSRKKLVNNPEYFSESESSHFFSYLTGWLEVDYIDDLDDDVIATNRQALNWGHPEMQKLKICLQKMINMLEKDWRVKRKNIREKKLDSELAKFGMTIGEWQKNVPDKIKHDLIPVLEKIVGNSELSDEEIIGAVKHLKKVLPPYTYYHYQNLHKGLSEAVFQYYADQNYYEAVRMGAIRYLALLRDKISKQDGDEEQVIIAAFKAGNPALSVVKIYESYKNKETGAKITDKTKDTISRGHLLLAQAMIAAFRNPVSHQEPQDLKISEIYTEQDCLDALSLLSHLFRRLDNAEAP